MVYSTRLFVVCLTLYHFVLVFFSPFSNGITSFGEERANLSALRMFDWFVLVWNCRFPRPLDVWEGLRFVIVALPGLFSYLSFSYVAIVLSLFPYLVLSFFWCRGKAVRRDCGISWVSSFIFSILLIFGLDGDVLILRPIVYIFLKFYSFR